MGNKRRRILQSLAGGGLVASGTWIKPVVETVTLPAHAQSSPDSDTDPEPSTCLNYVVEITSEDSLISVPGNATVVVCITNNSGSPLDVSDTDAVGFGAIAPLGDWGPGWISQIRADIGELAPGATGCSEQTRNVTAPCDTGTLEWNIIVLIADEECNGGLEIPCSDVQ